MRLVNRTVCYMSCACTSSITPPPPPPPPPTHHHDAQPKVDAQRLILPSGLHAQRALRAAQQLLQGHAQVPVGVGGASQPVQRSRQHADYVQPQLRCCCLPAAAAAAAGGRAAPGVAHGQLLGGCDHPCCQRRRRLLVEGREPGPHPGFALHHRLEGAEHVAVAVYECERQVRERGSALDDEQQLLSRAARAHLGTGCHGVLEQPHHIDRIHQQHHVCCRLPQGEGVQGSWSGATQEGCHRVGAAGGQAAGGVAAAAGAAAAAASALLRSSCALLTQVQQL